MSFTNADLLAIKSELTHDPKTLGLTTNATDDEANADKLNLVRDAIEVTKYSLSSSDLFNSIDPSEYQALGSGQKSWFDATLALPAINPFMNATLVTGIRNLFATNTTSRPSFEAAILESGSRVVQMYQTGLISTDPALTPSDIANARNAT